MDNGHDGDVPTETRYNTKENARNTYHYQHTIRVAEIFEKKIDLKART